MIFFYNFPVVFAFSFATNSLEATINMNKKNLENETRKNICAPYSGDSIDIELIVTINIIISQL